MKRGVFCVLILLAEFCVFLEMLVYIEKKKAKKKEQKRRERKTKREEA